MKAKTAKSLPKTIGEITTGGVYLQRVRCGKSNCKCARGAPHTAYYYFASRDGKLCKFYIRKDELAGFSCLLEQSIAERKRRRQAAIGAVELLRKFRASLSENDRLIKASTGEQNNGENNL